MTAPTCPECGHPAAEHQVNGCRLLTSGRAMCLCALTPEQIKEGTP